MSELEDLPLANFLTRDLRMFLKYQESKPRE